MTTPFRLVYRRYCVIFAWLAVVTGGFADSQWFHRSWQTDDGLPNNYVTTVLPGPDGFLWVATRGGLSRFDGEHFTPVTGENEDQNIRTIVPGITSNFWILPYRGSVIRVNPDLSRGPLTVSSLPREMPSGIVEDKTGGLWLAYPDELCRVKDGDVTRFNADQGVLASKSFNSIVCDRDGYVWIAKNGIVAVFQNGEFKQMGKYPHVRLAPSINGGVWIATGDHLIKCNPDGWTHDFGAYLPESAKGDVRTLMEDHSGAVWIGTAEMGLFRYGGIGFERIDTSQATVLSLAEDKEGNVWAGTEGGGLDRITSRGIRLETSGNSSLPMIIQSVCEDSHGTMWAATQNGMLVSRIGGQWVPALTNYSLADVVTCVAADKKGAIWIGTREHKLYRWQRNDLTLWAQKDGLSSRVIVDLFIASNGDVWIGGYVNQFDPAPILQYLHGDELRKIDFPNASPGKVTAITEDISGQIWVSTGPSGTLWCIQENNPVNESSLLRVNNRTILSLFSTSDGAVWIGYNGSGLGRLKNGRFSRLTVDQGLYDNQISQIITDDRGWVWFGSSRGIFKVREQALDLAFEHGLTVQSIRYGPNEGLFSSDADSVIIDPYVAPTAVRTREGRLWIPMRLVLASIDPNILHENFDPPPIRFTGMIVDGKKITSPVGKDGSDPNGSWTTLKLSPAHQRIDFDFTALNFSAPENIHLQYRLAGLDSGWIDAGPERSAHYSRLTAGDYQFLVRGRTGDGDWTAPTMAAAFLVKPFVWQTWWFQLLAMAVFTVLVAAVVRYVSFRRLRMRLIVLEQEAALNRERARIARDIHDDLGGNLTQVKQLFELTSRHRASPEQVHEFVQRGLAVTRQGVKSLDETVWAVNPRNDTLPDLINYIGQRTVEFLSIAGVRYHMDLPEHPPALPVSAEVRHNIFFIVKEALNNIVRHANATEVWLHIIANEEIFSLSIRDDGQGFEQAPDSACEDGLRNMRARMEIIKGQFEVESQPGAGTKISITYSWPR